MSFPFVSVIIVNYNGAHFLPTCLDALRASSYPADSFEVIVSDNASTDGSLGLLQSKYPWVRVLPNDRNLGFASGNNVAIKIARGEFIVLLNNDTRPAHDWLEHLVGVAKSDSRAGLITGNLQLFYDQVILKLHSETICLSNDARVLGVQVFKVNSQASGGVVQYLEGFYGWEGSPLGSRFRWTRDTALLGVPVPNGTGEWRLGLFLAASRPNSEKVRVKVSLNDVPCAEWSVSGSEPSEYVLSMPASARRFSRPLVQNTGSIVFRNGASRDRGTFIRNAEVFYETDGGQYNRVEEVFSGCGASLLIRKKMLEQVGAFDDDFFMYYEDTDLAWRARLQGWKVVYAPQALVRHVHCGTIKEWSPVFIFHAERNRLGMVFKNGAPRQVLWAWGRYLASIANNTWRAARAFLQRQDTAKPLADAVRIQYRVLGALVRWLPALWQKRLRIQRTRTAPLSSIEAWFVD